MRLASQLALFLIWLLAVCLWMTAPPPKMPPQQSNPNQFITGRTPYNPAFAVALDQNLRNYWQKPQRVLGELGDLNGLRVADIGCGEGYFTLKVLERVGSQGKVYAVDILTSQLEKLAKNIPHQWLPRITLVQSKPNDITLKKKVDLIFVVQVLAEVRDQRQFLQQLRTIMKPQSRLVVIDSKHITDPQSGFTKPLNLNTLKKGFAEEGFFLQKNLYFLPKQFFYIFSLQPESSADTL